jgi:hypothetical protein
VQSKKFLLLFRGGQTFEVGKMNIRDNGGPAFPRPYSFDDQSASKEHAQDGMALRDYFAAKAMQGLLSCSDTLASLKEFAEISYKQADAMLEARKS